jgi:hypothetical protein
MIARIAYLTSPAPGVFMLNFQMEGETGCQRIEISKAHLANIVIDGAALSLRENRVHPTPNQGTQDDGSNHQSVTIAKPTRQQRNSPRINSRPSSSASSGWRRKRKPSPTMCATSTPRPRATATT